MRKWRARRLLSLAPGAIPDGIAAPGGEGCARRGPRSAAGGAVARMVCLGGMLAAAACGKSPAPSGGGDAGVMTSALCEMVGRDPGPSPLRRLTRAEYGRSLRDLLGPGAADMVDPTVLPPDERALGFDNNADVLGSSDLLVEQYGDLAEKAGAVVAADPGRYAACAGAAGADDACGAELIRAFGRKAWRRPLTADEEGALATVFATGVADNGFSEGVARVVEVVLQSPQFLYRIELGRTDSPAATASDRDLPPPGAVALAPYEMATRLAYLLWGTAPDDALLAVADADGLATTAAVAAQARRMLADPRAHEVVAQFHAEWLALDKLDDLDKDPVVFPTFTPELRREFRDETTRFVDEVVWNREGTLGALLSARYTFADATLATFYGVAGVAGTTFQKIDLDPSRRAGLLTQPSFLAVHAKANQTSPVHRGRFVREQLFCTTPPPPPANIEIRPPGLDPRQTTRQRFAAHTADPFCASCHTLLDPIGFGFEHYDGLGRWRDTEGGQPIDATGALTGTDVDGPFDGAPALADRLAGSAQVAACYARQWFRFGYGRGETQGDACTLDQLNGSLAASGGDVRELLVALTQTDAFRFRRASETTP